MCKDTLSCVLLNEMSLALYRGHYLRHLLTLASKSVVHISVPRIKSVDEYDWVVDVEQTMKEKTVVQDEFLRN